MFAETNLTTADASAHPNSRASPPSSASDGSVSGRRTAYDARFPVLVSVATNVATAVVATSCRSAPIVLSIRAILEAKSPEEAIELTRRFLKVHGDVWDLECEVRPLDVPEFGARAG